MIREGFSLDTSDHENFEQLCTLVAAGEANSEQQSCLKEHLRGCGSCLSFLQDVGLMSAELIQRSVRDHDPLPTGMTERFIARARTEGIPLSPQAPQLQTQSSWLRKRERRFRLMPALIAASITLVIAGAGVWTGKQWLFPSQPVLTTVPPAAVIAQFNDIELAAENSRLRKQLEIADLELSSLREDVTKAELTIQNIQAEKSSLQTRLMAAEQSSLASQRLVAEGDSERQRLQQAIDELDAKRVSEMTSARVEQVEVSKLQSDIEKLQQQVSEQKQLVAQGSEARELITARRLHLVDVYDNDSNSKTEKAFGRIYYAEGKKLVFYAYDLGDPRKLNTTFTFYLWGQRQGTEASVKLGIFHNDDPHDRRWVINCTDTQALASIDSVFVTIEKKSVEKPSGKHILFAFLGEANHP